MQPFMLIHGDARDRLRAMPDDSVDSIVTDPPYELNLMAKDWDRSGVAFDPSVWAECLRVIKPGGHLLAFGGARTYHRMACAIEDAGFEVRDQIMWLYGSGMPKGELWTQAKADKGQVESASMIAAGYKGWARAGLKPSHEPICMARKPFPGNVAKNMLKWGVGGLNIDACRIPTEESLRIGAGATWDMLHKGEGRAGEASAKRRYTERGATNFAMLPGPRGGAPAGRWPANVIHDGSDEVLAGFPTTTSGSRAEGVRTGMGSPRTMMGKPTGDGGPAIEGNCGSAARFFYCAKASRTDRNEGCEHLERKPLHWSSGDANPGSFQNQGTDRTSPNFHPTVKPTSLMAQMIELITPAGGLVLDPFAGSGSTGKAAVREGYRFIGIELQSEFVEIARMRITFEWTRSLNRKKAA